MNIGLSISTYSDSNTPIERYSIIENCLQSLLDNLPNDVYINIVSDGMTEQHRAILNKFPFEVIERDYNGGVAEAKNTGIKAILDKGCNIGFLCDDDMIFKSKELFNAYADTMTKTGIPHMCLFLEDNGENCRDINHNGTTVKKTPWVNGCFLTFTKQLIEEIGYFKVLPYKYGHEHSNFTRRCVHQNKIPYYCDIINSRDYIDIDKSSLSGIKSISNVDYDRFKDNEHASIQNLDEYVPIVEKTKISLIVPTTSRKRNFKTIEDSPLISTLLKTFLSNIDEEYHYTFYVGHDSDDKFYINERDKILDEFSSNNIKIIYKSIENIDKSPVYIWNELFKSAYNDGQEYFYQIGDDIEIKDNWTKTFVNKLKTNNDIGVVGPLDMGNSNTMTQSFVSRKHMDIFGYYFPSEFKNWYCDDWIQQSYDNAGKLYWLKDIKVNNSGGEPRYVVDKTPSGFLSKIVDDSKNKILNYNK